MEKVFVGCSMLQNEIEQVMQEMGLKNKTVYIDAALHVEFRPLRKGRSRKTQ